MKKSSITRALYERLYAYYGPQKWWPASHANEILLGAVLTQNTRWTQVEKSLLVLKEKTNLDFDTILNTSDSIIFDYIRYSGFYVSKTQTIKDLLSWFKSYDYNYLVVSQKPTQVIKKELLNIKGIGLETANALLLYTFGHPVFVVDKYTRSLFTRLGYTAPKNNEHFAQAIEADFQGSVEEYNELHALIVRYGKAWISHLCVDEIDILANFSVSN